MIGLTRLDAALKRWNQIAANTVVGSGAKQPEGFIYMAYVSSLMTF
jgi:hypothetical protein